MANTTSAATQTTVVPILNIEKPIEIIKETLWKHIQKYVYYIHLSQLFSIKKSFILEKF